MQVTDYLQRSKLLSRFKDMLNEGGAILLDVFTITAFETMSESATYEKNQLFNFWSANDYYAFVNVFKYDAEKVMLNKYKVNNISNRSAIGSTKLAVCQI